jgi:hypothetical protein
VGLPVIIEGPSGRSENTLLALDTGSPYTILSKTLAKSLGLTEDRKEGPSHLLAPTGPQIGYKIRARSLTVMGQTLEDFRIRCHDLEKELEVDGVIGLDVIRRGDLLVSLPRGRVEFRWV